MDIYQVADQFKISLPKLRKMQKHGLLLCEGTSEIAQEIRYYVGKGQQLTVAQLLAMIENPPLLVQLGNRRAAAEGQLCELGDVEAEKAPAEVVASIDGAARAEPDSVAALVPWLKATIPARGTVGHHYLAVRLLLGSTPNLRKYDIKRIPRALLNCRNSPDFAGWWKIEEKGSRKRSIYRRPKEFDL